MLFTLKEDKNESKGLLLTSGGGSSSATLRRQGELADAVQSLPDGHTLHWASKGQWSMHEMAEAMLEATGPATVYMTTWTITEDPVRRLFMLKERGLIEGLHCLLDYRIRDRKPEPFQLLQGISDTLGLAQCHAKAAIAIGREKTLSCIGSANFSKNPRIEAGILSSDRAVGQFHQSWIKQEIENAKR